MTRTLARTVLALATLSLMAMSLSGCIPMLAGYLVAKAVEGPQTVTTTCTQPVDGSPQVCTTVSR